MRKSSKILVETTKMQKAALTSVLREYGATLTEWFTDNIAEATAEYSASAIDCPDDVPNLEKLKDPSEVLATLRQRDWAFSEEDTTYLSHDIHPYPAKFIPQIPRNLIARLSLPGEKVWDPFGGSGTTALESVLLGRQAISSDVNPLAEIIGNGKLVTLTKEEDDLVCGLIEELLIISGSPASVREALRGYQPLENLVPEIPNLSDWFHPHAALELAYLKARIGAITREKCQRLARVCFSKIILKASFQDSETRYVRCERDFPAGKVLRLFAGSLESSLKKVRYLGRYLKFREGSFQTIDLRRDSLAEPNCIDLIVTSPPYPNANDYHLYHRFRLFWLGFDPRDLAKKEIGSHLRHQKEHTGVKEYLEEIGLCLRNMLTALRPGRFAVIVIGDCLFHGKVFHTASLVGKRAQEAGFEVVGEIERVLPIHRRSFMSTARRLRSESLLLLRKPLGTSIVHIYPPAYKLWDYETVIRKTEISTLLGIQPSETLGDVLVAEISPLQVDRLKRLTFSRAFEADDISRELTWQAIIENGDGPALTSRKDPKYVTHGIHAYKGKFYPQLARSLFNLGGLNPGETVLDPFCGSGTVSLEAYLNGLRGVGIDMNPLAVKIARAKTEILLVDPYLRDRVLGQFQQRVSTLRPEAPAEVFDPKVLPEIQSWFPPNVVCKLSALLRAIREVPETRVKELLEVLLSSIVREVSQQDPQDLRIRRRSKPIQDAPVFELFSARLAEQRQRLGVFAVRSNKAPCRFVESQVLLADSRDPECFRTLGLRSGSVDGIVTSPPYATALPYIDTDRLSILLLCGLCSSARGLIEESLTGSREIRNGERRALEALIESGKLQEIPSPLARKIVLNVYCLNKHAPVGFRRKNMAALLYRYFMDMSKVLRNLDTCLKRNGSAFFVIGDSATVAGDEMVSIRSGEVLLEIAEHLGWELERRIPITVTKENRPHSKHSITENDILWFKKLGRACS
jgi:DNA modification methylase